MIPVIMKKLGVSVAISSFLWFILVVMLSPGVSTH